VGGKAILAKLVLELQLKRHAIIHAEFLNRLHMSFTEAVTQLTEAPGSLIYHITLAMSLGVLFSIARVFRKNSSDPEATRWVFASGSLLVLRLLILAVDGMAWIDVFSSNTLLPTFDRFASLAGLLVFTWVYELPIPKLSKFVLFFGSLINLIVIFLVPNFLPVQGEAVPFNHTMVDALWSFLSLILVVAATITLLTLRPKGWNQAIWSFAILTLGMLLHISQGPPTASAAGYVHFVEIAAYPLFTIGAIRALAGRQMGGFVGVRGSADALPSFEQIAFLEVAADLATSPLTDDETQFERQVVEIIARGLKIDLSILLRANRQAGRIEIVTGFDLPEERPLPISAFDANLFPDLSKALHGGNYHQVVPQARKSELYAFDSIVGRKLKETLHLFPLRSGREVIGGLLATDPKSYPLTSPINQARMREVVSILAQRINSWRVKAPYEDGLLGAALQDDAHFRIQQVEEEKIQLEEALLAIQQKVNAAELIDGGPSSAIEQANEQEIQRLEAEVVRLSSALVYKEDPLKDDQVEQLISERKVALEELAAVRNAVALMEQMEEKRQAEEKTPEASPDAQALLTIAQELRHPMSAIQIYTELLLNEAVGILGTLQENFLERIKSAAENVGQLLNDLTRINPAEISGLQIEHKNVNLSDCLDAAISMTSAHMKERDIVLRIDFPDEHPTLLADEDSIIQILYHLLAQAISSSPQGEQIELLSGEKDAEDQSFLTISIRDAGEKITPEILKEVIQIEDQTEVLLPAKTDHGLLIVKNLVSMLGGRIWVEYKKDSGNLFTVLLPIVNERVPA
jgi:signal transduction histidine kinase